MYAFVQDGAAARSPDALKNCKAFFWGRERRFLRVAFTLFLAGLWTIPVGVLIGLKPKLSAIAQPIAQVAASVPATALFPIILLVLIRAGGGLGIGSIVLLLLGTQWYILFNVIAGAIAIPTDLKEVCSVFRFGRTGALAGTFAAGNLSLFDHGICDGIRRSVEREHRRRIFQVPRAHLSDDGVGGGDQRRDGHGEFSGAAGGDDFDGGDGGDDQPAGVAAALQFGGDAISPGDLIDCEYMGWLAWCPGPESSRRNGVDNFTQQIPQNIRRKCGFEMTNLLTFAKSYRFTAKCMPMPPKINSRAITRS